MPPVACTVNYRHLGGLSMVSLPLASQLVLLPGATPPAQRAV